MMSDNLYKMFDVDKEAEKGGIDLDFGIVRLKVARAGGSNKEFSKVFKEKASPFRYAIDHSQLNEEDSNQIMAEVYAETVILGWESRVKNKETGENELDAKGKQKWVNKIETLDGKMVPFSVDACVKLLIDLPELFREIQASVNTADGFRKDEEAEDLGNLSES